ncbi:MAG: MBL fold metallo-hydrolase [Pseudomonadales bacterium]
MLATKSLRYPFENTPEPGTIKQVADGVYWLRMPLPMALDHINLYLLEDEAGWYIVDTGMRGEDKQKYWQQIFDTSLGGKPVIGVIVTHMHPDHVGQAGWLTEKWRVPLYMTRLEYLQARVLVGMPGGVSWTTEQHMHRIGLSAEYIDKVRQSSWGFGDIVEPLPMAYKRLAAGTVLPIGGNDWRVIIGEGHSPEHACLYSSALNVLLSGDQVIPRITSNISVMASEPEANPLADWLSSLQQFFDLPDDTLILPSHNTPFYGLHERVAFLLQHHEDHMVALEKACVQPQTAVELLPVLFKRKLVDSQITMALGECVAHLNLLIARERVSLTLDYNGVYQYQTIDPEVSARQLSADYFKDEPPVMV